MTPAEIIYHRRVRVLAHAKQTGNVAATCRTFGVSRTRFYEWRNVAEQYGLEALMPKTRREPQMPNATPNATVPVEFQFGARIETTLCRARVEWLAVSDGQAWRAIFAKASSRSRSIWLGSKRRTPLTL